MTALAGRLAAALQARGAGLLLDLDGTLVDSEPTHVAAFRSCFSRRGWDVPEGVLPLFAGRRGAEVFASVTGPWDGEDPVALAAEVIGCIDVEAFPPAPVPGAAAALRRWLSLGVPTAVVTSATRPWASAALELLGADVDALTLVTAEVVTRGKPDPEPYRTGARMLGVDPAACVAAEDTPAGVRAARAAGVGLVLGVTTSQPAQALLDAGAHASAPDLTALAG